MDYFYSELQKYYEGINSEARIRSNLSILFQKAQRHKDNPQYPQYDKIYDSLMDNELPLKSLDHKLLETEDIYELRIKVLLMSGLRQKAGDEIFGRGYFTIHGENKKPTFGDTSSNARLAAFLDLPFSILISSMDGYKTRDPWFYYAPESSINKFYLPYDLESKNFKAGLFNIGEIFGDSDLLIGLSLLYTPEYVEFTISTNEIFTSFAMWQRWLIKLADECGITGPCVFTVTSPFIIHNSLLIYKLSFIPAVSPHTLVILFTRIFSIRTQEVTLCTPDQYKTYKFPLEHKGTITDSWNQIREKFKVSIKPRKPM